MREGEKEEENQLIDVDMGADHFNKREMCSHCSRDQESVVHDSIF